jgi:hypothetical protein
LTLQVIESELSKFSKDMAVVNDEDRAETVARLEQNKKRLEAMLEKEAEKQEEQLKQALDAAMKRRLDRADKLHEDQLKLAEMEGKHAEELRELQKNQDLAAKRAEAEISRDMEGLQALAKETKVNLVEVRCRWFH